MKKYMIPIAALLMAGLFMIPVKKAAAQMGYGYMPQTTFGIKAGPSFSNLTSKSGGDKDNSDILVGLQGGVYANIPIAPQFYIQPSLMYEGKGGKKSETYSDDELELRADVKERLHYLTLPVDFLFKPEMPNGSGAWIIGVGPYIGYGISGKGTTSGNAGEETTSTSYNPFKENIIGEDDPALKRFDAGANVQLGYEMANGFNIGLNANLGLVNIMNKGD